MSISSTEFLNIDNDHVKIMCVYRVQYQIDNISQTNMMHDELLNQPLGLSYRYIVYVVLYQNCRTKTPPTNMYCACVCVCVCVCALVRVCMRACVCVCESAHHSGP